MFFTLPIILTVFHLCLSYFFPLPFTLPILSPTSIHLLPPCSDHPVVHIHKSFLSSSLLGPHQPCRYLQNGKQLNKNWCEFGQILNISYYSKCIFFILWPFFPYVSSKYSALFKHPPLFQ